MYNPSLGIFSDAVGTSHTALHATIFPLWLAPDTMNFDAVSDEGHNLAQSTLSFLRLKGMKCSV